MSKPINEQFKNVLKLSKTDDSIKTAPDGRLIIVDDNLEPLSKSGELINAYTTILI